MRPLPLILLLGACAAPDLEVPNAETLRRSEYPSLIPLSDLAPTEPAITAGTERSLIARSDAARARANTAPAAASGPSLEARAEEIRNRAAEAPAGVTEAERARLAEARQRLDALRE